MSEPDHPVLIVTGTAFDDESLPAGTLLLLHRGTAWSQTACIPLARADAGAFSERVQESVTEPMRVAVGRVQPGLDMWRPHGPARAAIGVVEYVTSAPETRQDYYRSQYTASAPAMRELWELGHVQRFVGFEIHDDLIPTDHGGWDVLHVTALTIRSLPKMARWTRRFDEHAQRAGYGSMRDLQARWATQRTKIERRTRIRVIGEQ